MADKIAMCIRALTLSAFIVFFAALVPASAAGCEQQARDLAAAQNAKLLAVSAQGNKCVVRLLITRNNQPPQRKTIVLDRK